MGEGNRGLFIGSHGVNTYSTNVHWRYVLFEIRKTIGQIN